MALDSQDFNKGVDFTGINPATGGDHNNLIEQAVPRRTDADETIGKGLNIFTTDSALDTPVVPNANTTTKWKRYVWCRRPFAGATDKSIKKYSWNDDATAHVTYLKWVQDSVDLTSVTAIANNALSTAQNAETTAGVAATNAASAVTTANAAQTTATTANNTANTAQTTATTANTAAGAAQTTATNAQNTANTALSTALGRKDVDDTLNPGTAFQKVRTNVSASAAEWYSTRSEYAKLTETTAKGVDAGSSSAGKNTRVLNTEDEDIGTLVTLAGGIVTITVAGNYYIRAWATMFDNGNNTHQLIIANADTNATLLTGDSNTFVSGGSISQKSFVSGVIVATANMNIRLDHYITNAQATNGLGQAANIHPDASGKEVYAGIELWLV